ncbi:MAG: hypothetical protein NT154_05485, partial [Verrucomicrobia bacterium]|nr:hypothetical protein [Verrucomicrobiota bacterium]
MASRSNTAWNSGGNSGCILAPSLAENSGRARPLTSAGAERAGPQMTTARSRKSLFVIRLAAREVHMTRMINATDPPTPPTPPTLFDYANIGPCGDFCAPSSQPLQPVAPRPSAVDQDRVERVLGGAGVGAGIMPC